MIPGLKLDTYAFEECLTRGAERIGWSKRGKPASGTGTRKRGHRFRLPAHVGQRLPRLSRHLRAHRRHRQAEPGRHRRISPRQPWTWAPDRSRRCARLRPPNSACRWKPSTWCRTPTPRRCPSMRPSHASRVTYAAGTAVQAAARAAKERLLKVAGHHAGGQPRGSGGCRWPGVGERRAREVALTRRRGGAAGRIAVHAARRAQGPAPTTIEEKGTIIGVSSLAPRANPSPVSVEFVEVEVDTETGAGARCCGSSTPTTSAG